MKKFLALLLALVMTMSLVTVGASAKTAFTDDKDITEVEAVEVLSAMGIIDGYKDGSFKPQGALNRAAGAKFIAYLMLGEKNADGLKATGTVFEDVAADYALAPYVEWCAKMGIVDGYGDGKFGPTNTLTQAAFGKMLLTALGYDSAKEGYTGAGWQKAVYADGLKAGVYGDDGEIFAACDRETAAKLALGALKATMVEYGKTVKLNKGTYVTENGAVVVKGDKRDKNNNGLELWETYKDLTYTANDPDAFGRPGHSWTYGKDKDFDERYLDTPVLTYTKAVKSTDLYTDLGCTDKNHDDVKVIEDGKDADAFKVISKGTGSDKKLGAKGTLVEIYDVTAADATTDSYLAVVVNTYVGTITKWTKAVKNSHDEIVTKENVTVGTAGTFNTTDFTADDATDGTVVLYTKAYNEKTKTYDIKSVKAADSKTLTATKVYDTGDATTATFTADGTTYEYAKNYENWLAVMGDKAPVSEPMVKNETEFDAYFDNYGYVIAVDEPAAATYDTAAYIVLDVEVEKLSAGKYFANVDVLNEKGEEETLKVAKDVNASNEAIFFATEAEAKGCVFFSELNLGTEHSLVALTDKTAKTGYYVLGDDHTHTVSWTNKVIDPNKTFKLGDEYADSKTVFFVEQYDKKDNMTGYEVYTGIQNVPSLVNASITNEAYQLTYVTLNYGTTADYASKQYSAVLVEGAKDATVTTTTRGFTGDVVYVIDETAEYDGAVYTYSAIVNGEKTTVASDIKLDLGHICYVTAYLKDSKTIASVRYNYRTVGGNAYAEKLVVTNHWAETFVGADNAVFFNNGVLYGNGAAVVVADDAVIYDCNEEDFVEMSDLKAGTLVLLGYDLNDKAAVKYIIVPGTYIAFDAWFYATNAASNAKRIDANKVADSKNFTVDAGDYTVDVDLEKWDLATYDVTVKNGTTPVPVNPFTNTFTVEDGKSYTVTITAIPKNLIDKEDMSFTVNANNYAALTITKAPGVANVVYAFNGTLQTPMLWDATTVTVAENSKTFKVGDTVALNIVLDEAYKDLVVKVNNEPITLKDGLYTFTAGNENAVVLTATAKCTTDAFSGFFVDAYSLVKGEMNGLSDTTGGWTTDTEVYVPTATLDVTLKRADCKFCVTKYAVADGIAAAKEAAKNGTEFTADKAVTVPAGKVLAVYSKTEFGTESYKTLELKRVYALTVNLDGFEPCTCFTETGYGTCGYSVTGLALKAGVTSLSNDTTLYFKAGDAFTVSFTGDMCGHTSCTVTVNNGTANVYNETLTKASDSFAFVMPANDVTLSANVNH